MAMTISLNELVGWWKLSRVCHEFPDAPTQWPFGHSATGSLVFTSDHRMMLSILGDGFSLNAHGYEVHSGRFALQGSEISMISDISSRREWTHIELKYSTSLTHGVLYLTSRQVGLLYDGAPFVAASSWVRQPEG